MPRALARPVRVAPAVADSRVAGYLGRVLDGDGEPAGTCFQVAAGVLVTAWHVLDAISAADAQCVVGVDPLAGGDAFEAVTARLDPVHDLAVLVTSGGLPGCAGQLAATDRLPLRELVSVTGHAVPDDPGHRYRFLVAPGVWAGGTTRDDAVPLGCLTSSRVVPGMSGAPVIRDGDGAVAGVVSGRYNSADGWLAGTVWVARTEDVAPLLADLADVTVDDAQLAGAVDLVFTVTDDLVRLTGPGVDVSAGHGGVRPGLVEAVAEVRRNRVRAGLVSRGSLTTPTAGEVALGRAGRLLAESFLPDSVAGELGRVLRAAERYHMPVRFGVATAGWLAGLPWECLPGPGGDRPLALHPLVNVYRQVPASAPGRVPGPLRLVVAISSPETGGSGVLDYERELRNVMAAVRSARQGAAHVRVVPFATPAAIFDCLDGEPAHVLHVSGHGSPGYLELENDDGSARRVSAEEFAEEALPPGKVPPVIALSACHTDAAGAEGELSFAAQLCRHGAAVVIATETSITDIYATRVFARVYARLATAGTPDAVAALADARREVQRQLAGSTSPLEQELAALDEWAVVTVLAGSGTVPVFDPSVTAPIPPTLPRPQIAGLGLRPAGYFVGRRAEQRSWPAELLASGTAGMVVHGIGGTGKTTLAAEIAGRVLAADPGRILISQAGPLTLEGLLATIISALRREMFARRHDGGAISALDVAARADLSLADRLAVLRDHVLDQIPALIVLDNFEDNLQPTPDSGYLVADQALAGLIAGLASDPAECRLLVTSRHPFTLPNSAEQSLSLRHLGPLSRAETMKLAWSLPALDQLDETQLDRIWRLAGGHPRSLEYVDALLSGGTARYPDVTARLDKAITARLGGQAQADWLAARTGLDAALAETIALGADDILLPSLLTHLDGTPGAQSLLLGVSVYREPVDRNAVLFQAGHPDPGAGNSSTMQAALEQVTAILAGAGIDHRRLSDPASLPEPVRQQLAPHLAQLNRPPAPPYRTPGTLGEQLTACQDASLLIITGDNIEPAFFVHRWTATELAELATRDPHRAGQFAVAHRRAAAYWRWRVSTWPQDKAADVHDLLEARHHLLQAGDIEQAGQVTEWACRQLDTWGAWDQETALIYDTLNRLPAGFPRHAAWIHHLGILAQHRGDYDEAERQYQQSLAMSESLGKQAEVAASYHNLGILAQYRGDYDEAGRQYQQSLAIRERLGDEAGVAASYHQLGILAQQRGDYGEAERYYRQSLTINERLGDQAGMAVSYGRLGVFARVRGNYDEAESQYQRALAISERLGNQAEMAISYQQLGILARHRGDFDKAESQYQRALAISERLGNQAEMAISYQELGILAQYRGDYDEAERQYRLSLTINERLGNQVGTADSHHNLGVLAYDRGNNDQAEREYWRALAIYERLGSQAEMAASYHNLGRLAQDRRDYVQAENQYQQSLTISERLGDQAAIAATHGQLGILAQQRGDYDQAENQYQQSLTINERLGDQAAIATTLSQLGVLEGDRGGNPATAISLHVAALTIRLRIGVPQAVNDLNRLAAHCDTLGASQFNRLLSQATGDPEATAAITGLIEQISETRDGT